MILITNVVFSANFTFSLTLLYVHFSIAIILMGKRELIALLDLSSWCFVMVERLFLAVPRGCLRFVIVVFPDHTHLLFFMTIMPIDNHPLTQRMLQFIGICVNKLTLKSINIIQSTNNYNIVSSFICCNQNIVQIKILDTSFKMTKRRFRFSG